MEQYTEKNQSSLVVNSPFKTFTFCLYFAFITQMIIHLCILHGWVPSVTVFTSEDRVKDV